MKRGEGVTAFHFHLATPRGEGGIAVFELYGGGATAALHRLFKPYRGALPDEGRTRLGDLVDRAGGLVDEAVVANVPAGSAWSRLACWTVAVHGGPWIQEKTREVFGTVGGLPLDLAGVLGLALRVGVLDAVQAAAYELLIGAHTERAARFFVRQHAGELSSKLRDGIALTEAGRLEDAARIAQELVERAKPAFRLGHPLRVLIAGRPNAGKSTLFNRLVEDERAIVTPIPGTTRDTLEELVAIEDYPVVVTDSAGIRSLSDAGPIEREGIQRVLERDDDAVIYLVPHPWRFDDEDRAFLSRRPKERVLVTASLADLARGVESPQGALRISALTGAGLCELRRAIVHRFIDDREPPEEDVPCAAFTLLQKEILSRVSTLRGLDAIRRAYIECLDSSWP